MNVNIVKEYARVVWVTAKMSYREMWNDLFVLFTIVIQPLCVALLALYMLRDKGSDYAIFVVVGGGMTGLWSSLVFISGNSITRERWTGTLEILVGLPTPLWVITLGKNLAHVSQSLISMIASYILASYIFGYALSVANPVGFVISLALTVIAFISFGLIMAPVYLINPAVQSFQNALEFPIYTLCGFLFPIALLPGWTTPLSYILPPYWAARVLHITSRGGHDFSEILFCWAMLLLFTVVYFALASRFFTLILKRARVSATLGLD